MGVIRSSVHAFLAVLAAVAGSAIPAPAHAGAGSLSLHLSAVSPQVTYSTASPPLNTFVALQGQVTNSGGNTINHVTITVSAFATDAAEAVVLFDPANTLPAGCAQTSPSQFTCTVKQMTSGAAFPTAPFTVFYRAPAKVPNGTADAAGSDYVGAHVHVVYAEGPNGATSPPQNSIRDFNLPQLVQLGTSTPSNVKSVVPKTGVSLFTGDTGIPSTLNKLTERAAIPALSVPFATSDITIGDATSDPQCANLAHFFSCPKYTTQVLDPTSQEAAFTTSPWLTTIYRIDASNLRMPTSKLLNSVQLLYTGGAFTDVLVNACVNGEPNNGAATSNNPAGVPCITAAQCFKKGVNGSQNGYCEWQLINIRNGSLKIL